MDDWAFHINKSWQKSWHSHAQTALFNPIEAKNKKG